MKSTKNDLRVGVRRDLEGLGYPDAIKDAIVEHLWSREKGRTSQTDAEINTGLQLSEAAQRLSRYTIPMEEAWMPPNGWDEALWTKYCEKPYRDRLVICAAWLISEVDRVDYCFENGVDLIPKIKLKPQEENEPGDRPQDPQ